MKKAVISWRDPHSTMPSRLLDLLLDTLDGFGVVLRRKASVATPGREQPKQVTTAATSLELIVLFYMPGSPVVVAESLRDLAIVDQATGPLIETMPEDRNYTTTTQNSQVQKHVASAASKKVCGLPHFGSPDTTAYTAQGLGFRV